MQMINLCGCQDICYKGRKKIWDSNFPKCGDNLIIQEHSTSLLWICESFQCFTANIFLLFTRKYLLQLDEWLATKYIAILFLRIGFQSTPILPFTSFRCTYNDIKGNFSEFKHFVRILHFIFIEFYPSSWLPPKTYLQG